MQAAQAAKEFAQELGKDYPSVLKEADIILKEGRILEDKDGEKAIVPYGISMNHNSAYYWHLYRDPRYRSAKIRHLPSRCPAIDLNVSHYEKYNDAGREIWRYRWNH